MPLPTLLTPGSLRVPEGRAAEAPIGYVVSWLKARMPEFGGRGGAVADRVLIVRSETGSGKSTVLPVHVFRILRSPESRARYGGPSVLCTQPRVLTAIDLARRQVGGTRARPNANYPDMVVGETVGFQTGPFSEKPPAGLVFATIGVLAAQLRTMDDESLMAKYRFIIVDEAHERSAEADVTLMRLRYFYKRNEGSPKLPFLILASATIEVAKYAAMFGLSAANTVEVVGRAYPIVDFWPSHGTNNYPEAAARKAIELHEKNADDLPSCADILIFVPGDGEIRAVRKILDDYIASFETASSETASSETASSETASSETALSQTVSSQTKSRPFLTLSINREAIVEDSPQFRLVSADVAALPWVRGAPPARRVVVSTVVAETGLTIETLKYVIDCGWSRTMERYQPQGIVGLITRPAPKSRVLQRKGRAGRVAPGEFHPLYTQSVYAALPPQQLPDLATGGVAPVILDLVGEQIRAKNSPAAAFRCEDVELVEPPPPDALAAALELAIATGFVASLACPPRRTEAAVKHADAKDSALAAVKNPDAKDSALAAVKNPDAKDSALAGVKHADAKDSALAGVKNADAKDVKTAAGPPSSSFVLTRFGAVAAKFSRTSLEAARIILSGFTWGCSIRDLATIAALLETPLASLTVRRHTGPPASPSKALQGALPRFLASVGVDFAKLIIADDFVEAMLVFQSFAEKLAAAEGELAHVFAYCAEVDLDVAALLAVAARREEILEDLIVAGVDCFWGEANSLRAATLEQFADRLTRLKRCIYDGLRLKLLTYDKAANRYRDRFGTEVEVPPLVSDATAKKCGVVDFSKPTHIVAGGLRFEAVSTVDPKPLRYKVAAGPVSVLDGFVDVDATMVG